MVNLASQTGVSRRHRISDMDMVRVENPATIEQSNFEEGKVFMGDP
jgi:hypothetical protein